MNNPLRELIANVELTKRDGYSHVEHRNARAALMGFMYDNAEAIADLIDAAQMCVVTAGPGTITDISPLRAALYKLTEGK